MTEIANKILLAGQPVFTYSAWVSFAKNRERIQKFKETGDSRYFYQNELDKACFENHTAG